MLVSVRSKGNTHPVVVGVQTYAASMEISVMAPQKAGNIFTLRSSYPTLWYIPTGLYNLLQRHLLNYVHCCSIHNS